MPHACNTLLEAGKYNKHLSTEGKVAGLPSDGFIHNLTVPRDILRA